MPVKTELVVGRRALDRKSSIDQTVGETEAKLVHHLGSDGVVIGNDQTAIMFHIDVVRQQRIRWEAQLTCVREQVLPTETGIDLLVGRDVVIQPGIKAVGIGRDGLQRFIVVAAPGATDIGQRVISVEQLQRYRIQHRRRNGVVRERPCR